MFIVSTFHAYSKGHEEISNSQKVTGMLELAGITGVTIFALLILANNSATFSVPGLNSMSNLSSVIMLGTAVPLLVINLATLIIYQKLVAKKKDAVKAPLLAPAPDHESVRLQGELNIKLRELHALQQEHAELKQEIDKLKKDALDGQDVAKKQHSLIDQQSELLHEEVEWMKQAKEKIENQKKEIEKLQHEKQVIEENLRTLEQQLSKQTSNDETTQKNNLLNLQKLQQQIIEQKQTIEQLSAKVKELETLNAKLQENGQLAGNANLDKAHFEKEKKRLEEEFHQQLEPLQNQLKKLGKQNRELQNQIDSNIEPNEKLEKQLEQKNKQIREYELRTSKLETEIEGLKKQLQHAKELHTQNQAQLTKEQEGAQTQSQLKIQELQKQLDESMAKRRTFAELTMEKEEKDKIREQLLAKNSGKTADAIRSEIAQIEASSSDFKKTALQKPGEVSQTTTTTTTSTPPQQTGGPRLPNGGPPPPPPPPNGTPKPPQANGHGKPKVSPKAQLTNGKEKQQSAGPPSADALQAQIIQRRRNAENNNAPKMSETAKKDLHRMLNSSSDEAANQLRRFKEILEDIKGYLRDKELTANFSLDGMSMNKRLGTFSILPASIQQHFLSLRDFIYAGSEIADKKARAKACRTGIEEEIVLTQTKPETSQTKDQSSLEEILKHAMSGMRPSLEGSNNSESDDEDDSWD